MEPRHIKLLRAAVKLAQAAPETDILLDGEVYDALWLRGQVKDHLRAVEGLFSDTTEWPEPRPPYEELLEQRQGCQDALSWAFNLAAQTEQSLRQEREAREKAEAERDQLKGFAQRLLDDDPITPENLEYWAEEYEFALQQLADIGNHMLDLSAQKARIYYALEELHSLQNGPPLERERKRWEKAMREAEKVLGLRKESQYGPEPE